MIAQKTFAVLVANTKFWLHWARALAPLRSKYIFPVILIKARQYRMIDLKGFMGKN